MNALSVISAVTVTLSFSAMAQMHPAGTASKSQAAPTANAQGDKPVYSSHVVTVETVGHAVDIQANIAGAKKLYLVVTDGGDGFGCDWCNWIEPRITGAFGEKKLTELKWVSATSEWGNVHVNQNAAGQPLVVNDNPVAEGIGTHANSVIEYDLPDGVQTFKARGGLDKGGVSQGQATSVVFQVWTSQPVLAAPAKSGGGGGGLSPELALAGLDVADGLEVATFAAEPDLLSPSAIDVDHRGRIWVAEIVNYRSHNGKRKEGDRILILEDTNHDGKCDSSKVFYQNPDFRSPHGVCVLGNKVIVSVGDKVILLVDENGDDQADKTEILFTGIHGTQHDHGIHAFHFGPDGKLYFNFGNEGGELKDKDGKPITDLAGNIVACNRKPYQQGCIFRCNPDLSEFETLAWNFRNNWEANVDSFGGIWQSDNDDDGNKSVRINFVVEFGNYGFRDELTGNGWQKRDAKTDEEVQAAHWHLFDPGVMPNLIHTGAGSPTGICIYEGDLLPKEWHGQVIHCDAGPNVVRAYPTTKVGAGFTAEMKPLLLGARDRWFRPSDVVVAPDGSLIVSDWYDPGVGGHAMGDLERGRIYRIAPAEKLHSYEIPKFDLSNPEGAAQALLNPNEAVRYLAWNALQRAGASALPALQKISKHANPRFRARALWAMGKLPGHGPEAVKAALADQDEDVRCMGIRLARQLKQDLIALTQALVKDTAQVRRECLVALRHEKSPAAAKVWAQLAQQHDGKDRWYLETLALSAQLHWDECFQAWLDLVGDQWNTPAGRDILWVSRSAQSVGFLAKAMKDDAVPIAEKLRLIRAFDYQGDKAAVQTALKSLLVN